MGGFFLGELLQTANPRGCHTRGEQGCVENVDTYVRSYEASRDRCIIDRGTPAQTSRTTTPRPSQGGRCGTRNYQTDYGPPGVSGASSDFQRRSQEEALSRKSVHWG